MKRFYFLRHEDVNGYSGTGVVAEGVIFDFGYGAFTWLTDKKTVTVFDDMGDIDFMHGHNGKTDIILEDNYEQFKECEQAAKEIKQKRKTEERIEEKRKETRREQARARRAKKKAETIKA